MQEVLYGKLGNPEELIALQNHMFGLLPAQYDRFPQLKQWFKILSHIQRQVREDLWV